MKILKKIFVAYFMMASVIHLITLEIYVSDELENEGKPVTLYAVTKIITRNVLEYLKRLRG